jgi:hypothetical protein
VEAGVTDRSGRESDVDLAPITATDVVRRSDPFTITKDSALEPASVRSGDIGEQRSTPDNLSWAPSSRATHEVEGDAY